MSQKPGGKGGTRIKERTDPYHVDAETLPGTDTRLTSLHFLQGGNIYVFTYEVDGEVRHTFVDAGDPRHRDQLLHVLAENDINPAHIERILITHHHVDHCGLADLLAEASGARVLVHARFRDFVEGAMPQGERQWFGDFPTSRLGKLNLVYLSPPGYERSVRISGIVFPCLAEPISVGESGRLHVLGCPEYEPTHTPDQMIFLYSVNPDPFRECSDLGDFLATDDLLFSGDLWLMGGPNRRLGAVQAVRMLRYRAMSTVRRARRNHREQDAAAKDALKKGFCIVRVKPGHGNEFIGARIIPNSLLADRDISIELGAGPGNGKSLLRNREAAQRVADIRERAYSYFVSELSRWLELGFTQQDISDLLVRIYSEQSGGNGAVRKDRKQRRKQLKATLMRLREDPASASWLKALAESALKELPKYGNATPSTALKPIPSRWMTVR